MDLSFAFEMDTLAWKYAPFKPAIKNVKLVLITLPTTWRALFSAKKDESSVFRDSRSWVLFSVALSVILGGLAR